MPCSQVDESHPGRGRVEIGAMAGDAQQIHPQAPAAELRQEIAHDTVHAAVAGGGHEHGKIRLLRRLGIAHGFRRRPACSRSLKYFAAPCGRQSSHSSLFGASRHCAPIPIPPCREYRMYLL